MPGVHCHDKSASQDTGEDRRWNPCLQNVEAGLHMTSQKAAKIPEGRRSNFIPSEVHQTKICCNRAIYYCSTLF